jgi:hypothetical protein
MGEAMTNILRYALSIILLVGYLIWLAITVIGGASNDQILNITNLGGLAVLAVSGIMPREKSVWKWVCVGLACLVFGSYLGVEFYLSPTDERISTLAWGALIFAFGCGIWLCHIAYRKWWPNLSVMPKVILTTIGIVISGVAALYILSVLLRGADWHDILITNWYVTLLVLYLPVFLGVLFLRSALEKRKIERKTDA